MLIHIPSYLKALEDFEKRFNEKTKSVLRDWQGDEIMVTDMMCESLDELRKEIT